MAENKADGLIAIIGNEVSLSLCLSVWVFGRPSLHLSMCACVWLPNEDGRRERKERRGGVMDLVVGLE